MEKERRTKALLLSTLVVVVATLSIAFAAMSRTLSINGIAKMDTASWSVYFDNLSNATTVRGAKEVGKPNISTIDNGILENIKVKLSNPKDEISYTVDIVNDGTIDAEITMIKNIELTDAQKKIFEFKVTYTDTGDVLKDGDLLPAGKTKNITINIRFKDDITEADLPKESQTINLSYQITYTQYDGEIPVGPNTGGGATTPGNRILAAPNAEEIFGADDPTTTTFFNGELIRNQVKSITFLTSDIVPAEYASVAWDASQDKDRSVMAWYKDSDTEGLKDVYVGANGKVIAPKDSTLLLAVFSNLTELNMENLDTSNVTNMTYMFSNLESLTNLDVSSLNTSKVTDMTGLFGSCAFTTLDLSSLDTTNVTNMSSMFIDCEALQSVNLSSFDTRKVTTMEDMFGACHSLVSLDLSNFYTPVLEDISILFEEAEVLTTVDLRNADFSKVTSYSNIFTKAHSKNIKIIVSEAQKEKATDLFITKQGYEATSLGVQVVTPSEL